MRQVKCSMIINITWIYFQHIRQANGSVYGQLSSPGAQMINLGWK